MDIIFVPTGITAEKAQAGHVVTDLGLAGVQI